MGMKYAYFCKTEFKSKGQKVTGNGIMTSDIRICSDAALLLATAQFRQNILNSGEVIDDEFHITGLSFLHEIE